MFRAIVQAKRKPGITMEEFEAHYEAVTPRLVVALSPFLRAYQRNYLTLLPMVPEASGQTEGHYDMVTILEFDSQEDFGAAFAKFATTPLAAEIVELEEKFFDRETITFFIPKIVKSEVPAKA